MAKIDFEKFSSFKLPTLYLLCFCINFASSTTNITISKFLNDSETLASSNSLFKLGFFSPINSTNRYVGIWYDIDPLEVVWVANRDSPLNDSSGVLNLSEDGNLQLSDEQNRIFWSTNVSFIGNNSSVAQLLDTGNLVLVSSTSGTVLWQSADHLTDALLSQITIKVQNNIKSYPLLRSWKNASNPSTGRFTLRLIPGSLPEFAVELDDKPYWRSGPWNGIRFVGIPDMNSGSGNGFRFLNNGDDGTLDFFFSWENQSASHYQLSYDGNVYDKSWDDANHTWLVWWQSMRSDCEFYGKCGPFGSCNVKDSPICKCLKGFVPKNLNEWSKGNWSGGCVRRTPLQSCNVTGGQDGFLRLKQVKIPDFGDYIFALDEEDCRRSCLGNCSCLAYALPSGIGCVVWNRSLIDIQEFSTDAADLYVRLAHSELGESTNLKIIIITVGTIIAAVILVVIFYCLWKWKGQRYGKDSTNKETRFVDESPLNQDDFKDLNLLTLKELEKATNSFSETNKLGRGGFGPVYKGKLEDGQEIAVKRLSRASGQGLQEFMNEVVVISKLQHRNLVRLYGCCVEGEEKLLVYEYMPNKSLDALLFDSIPQRQLDWKTRFNIINGICRGLLYLHRDSRLKIIHRDLKASNVLLDEELNPKISDFGMARIFETKQDEANTLRVVGTYGYMSPEYAMEGRFSQKSDIFSLGVLLLEIVSGRKNASFISIESSSLLTYAWKLWNENNILSLIDSTIFEPCFKDEILKCIQLGLLCVQEFPEDRPNISELLSMLDANDNTDLPLPTQPGFTHRRTIISDDDIFQSSQEYGSINNVSLTAFSGR